MNSLRHDWYQNQSSVNLDIFIKNLNSSNVSINFSEKTVHVKIETAQVQYDKTFQLFEIIDEKQSKFSIGKVKLEIQMIKKVAGQVWASLESHQTEETDISVPKYPSSAKKPVDLSSIDEADLKDVEPTGEAAINSLFQKIYADANEDTRRAMMKSFIESKGTVLSTNWEEVGEKVIEPVPPKNS